MITVSDSNKCSWETKLVQWDLCNLDMVPDYKYPEYIRFKVWSQNMCKFTHHFGLYNIQITQVSLHLKQHKFDRYHTRLLVHLIDIMRQILHEKKWYDYLYRAHYTCSRWKMKKKKRNSGKDMFEMKTCKI